MNTSISSAIKEVSHLLDMWLPLRLQYDKVPGVSIAIVYKDEILYSKSFGYADFEKHIEANEETLYHIGSVSKIFTSVAIFQLVEQHKITLDDVVSNYLPWFKGENEHGKLEDITIRQLLSHKSGIWGNGDTPHWVTSMFPTNLQSLSKETLVFEPSSVFKYSNYGFAILGEVIAAVSGMSYEEYIQKNIFNTIGMNSTFVDYKDTIEYMATGYGREIPNQSREVYAHCATNAYAPATGFISNATDLALFLAHVTSTALEEILSKQSKEDMMHEPEGYCRGNEKYCLGIEQYQINNKKMYGHGGGFKGFVSQVTIDPETELGVVVLTNGSKAPVWAYTQSIFQAIYDIVEHQKSYSLQNKFDGSSFEGIYRNSGGDTVIVQIKDMLISFDINTSSPFQGTNKKFLESKGDGVFVLNSDNGFDSNGELVRFTDMKEGKSQTVFFGPTPRTRVE